MISDSQLENDVYQLQFTCRINDLFHRQILIGQRNNINQIISVQICFYDEDGEIIRDNLGNPKEYTSNRHNLGHVLDISSEEELVFSYATCRLQLQPNSNFYPDSLFFHLPQSSSTFQFNENINVYNAVFHIRWFNASPDTYERPVLTINDQIPAPTIIVNQGDLINITLVNELSEPTAIHWHGLLQRNSLHMDGVPGVTQCEILPGQSFIYTYSTENQSGTYWYHSHYTMQYGDGLKGILIIKDPNDPWKSFYQDEEILQITDWYHIPAYIHLKTYLYPGTLDPIPDTALINGIGQFDCDLNRQCSYYHASIRLGQTKRFRIINTSVYATITLTIDQHRMRLIEVDGISLNGKKYVRSLRLNPGQRYSVLITSTKNSNRNYWIRATMHPFIDYNNEYHSAIQPNARAILQYVDENLIMINSSNDYMVIINRSITFGEIFSDEAQLIPMISNVPIGENVRKYFFESQHKGSKPGYFYLNNHTFVHPTNRSLLSLLLYDNLQKLSISTAMHVENDEIIDLIINNIDFAPHPFHLHGHHVWILAQGKRNDGYVNETTLDNIKYNLKNPVYRDTFTINPYSYVIVRFKADNPGIWMLHCHNDWHLQLGMATVIVESPTYIKEFYTKHNLINQIPIQCQHHS
ncbi:unnamed protein product [Adineta steineri]|uniref:Multicopper oxidase n=1 Tax=Adineta steineri TaxID=433720 RepID=A0A813U1K5_9BILA|nr:unnamed protein product [Adineta steineri]CAF3931942.1 unnamed protein product [Adineta steineri]